MPVCTSYVRKPNSAQPASLDARRVGLAYNYPGTFTGKGYVGGIIELGGTYRETDLAAYFGKLGLPTPQVSAVNVGNGKPVSDPNGADVEVALDIQVAGAVAPGASYKVFFADNSDAGFLAAIKAAGAECHAVSISWGGPEDQWDPAVMHNFDAEFAALRAKGVPVFCAAGDNGSGDGETGKHCDFPASSPNVVGCGGTRLTLDAKGARATETVWDDSTSSATGGGVSAVFAGRQVPDVAGNADPQSGYEIVCNGQWGVVGGTSAVAPLMLGLHLLLLEATGGKVPDWLSTIPANPTTCFDVTAGSNGAFRAGPGRDECTGFGVPDGGRLLAVISAPTPAPVPQPPAPTPPPAPAPVPPPPPASTSVEFAPEEFAALSNFSVAPHHWRLASAAAKAWRQANGD